MPAPLPLSALLSQVLVAHSIELDNEFERRLAESGESARPTSVVMWSNFLRFVGDGITVGELPAAAGLRRARVLSNLGGMERWRYPQLPLGEWGWKIHFLDDRIGYVALESFDRGAILIQQLTGLSQLPVGVRVPFFAGFVPIRGAEGSPGRMFALIEEEKR